MISFDKAVPDISVILSGRLLDVIDKEFSAKEIIIHNSIISFLEGSDDFSCIDELLRIREYCERKGIAAAMNECAGDFPKNPGQR